MKNSWLLENKLIVEDLEGIISDKVISWHDFEGKKVLVTGATGLLGSLAVKTLLYCSDFYGIDLQVGAFIRNRDKANTVFGNLLTDHDNLVFEIGDISSELNLSQKYDYIIHTASNTASSDFVDRPVETILTTIDSTNSLLKYSLNNDVKSIVFLSSMEVYGTLDHELAKESDSGILDHNIIRNCYPQSKRVAENLCVSYFKEYGVHSKVVRLTQTFGPGIVPSDQRVFAQFARSVINKSNIVLLTKGGTKRDYLYTADAIKGIISVLLLGSDGEIYNLSNNESYCSILEMAELYKKVSDNQISIEFNTNGDTSKYLGEFYRLLDNSKVSGLNNFSRMKFEEQIRRTVCYLESLVK